MKYRDLIKKAWKITTKHKVLWFFAGFVFIATNIPLLLITNFIDFSQEDAWSWAIGLRCLTSLATLALTPITTAALVIGFKKGSAARNLRARQLFHSARKYYWRLFFIPFIMGAILLAIAIMGSLAFVILSICAFPLLILLFPLLLIVPIGIVFTYISIVIEDFSVRDAISYAKDLTRNNLGAVIALALISLVISLTVGYASQFGLLFVRDALTKIWDSPIWWWIVTSFFVTILYAIYSITAAFSQGLLIFGYLNLKKRVGTTKAVHKTRRVHTRHVSS